ncbi:MAG: hypothetical protein ACE5R4_14110 [Armatimonadota bacterium]
MRAALWLLATVLAGVCAQAQSVSIAVKDAPINQVLAQLQEQTGAELHSPFNVPDEEPKVTIDVKDAPLRRVLHELAGQAGCYVAYDSWPGEGIVNGRYRLHQGRDPYETAPTAVVGPYRLYLRNAYLDDRVTLRFLRDAGGEQAYAERRMRLELEIRADDDLDLARVYALDPHVLAVDDRGEIIATQQVEPSRWEQGEVFGLQPQAVLSLNLGLPGPQAAELALLEGDLLVYTSASFVELAVPLADAPAAASEEDCTLALLDLRQEPDGRYRVHTQLRVPDPSGEGGTRRRAWGVELRLETARGKPLRGPTIPKGSGQVSSREGYLLHDCQWLFDVPEGVEPARLVCRLGMTGEELERLTYQFENVPLSPDLVRQRVRP